MRRTLLAHDRTTSSIAPARPECLSWSEAQVQFVPTNQTTTRRASWSIRSDGHPVFSSGLRVLEHLNCLMHPSPRFPSQILPAS